MSDILSTVIQFFISLSLLVVIHEFGHFISARLFGVRVEKFYLFFDPWFSLFKYKPRKNGTEYGVGWLPLGGYVKIAGMVDESMDKEQLKKPAQPDEFRAKPAGQRLIIMIAGVIMNFLLAIFIYSMMLFAWGDTYLPVQNAKLGMDFSPIAQSMGFKNGDVFLTADNVPFTRYNETLIRQISEAESVSVLRRGQRVEIPVPEDFMMKLIAEKQGFASFRIPMVVDQVLSSGGAAKAGICSKDSIVGVNNFSVTTFFDFKNIVSKQKSNEITLHFYRNGVKQSTLVKVDTAGFVGVIPASPLDVYPTITKKYNFFTSFPAGITQGVNKLKGYVSDMQYVFTKEGAQNVGSFFTIGSLFPADFDAKIFWNVTAFLSVILAFMNILPIPALDGGHVLFLLYEVVTRRKPSDKFLEYAQIVGMVILFALMALALGNDIRRFFF